MGIKPEVVSERGRGVGGNLDQRPDAPQSASFGYDLTEFSRASDRLLAEVLSLKAGHGKKATQECLSSVPSSMKLAGMVNNAGNSAKANE